MLSSPVGETCPQKCLTEKKQVSLAGWQQLHNIATSFKKLNFLKTSTIFSEL